MMPYIYKYVNAKTGDVEYVGIINSDTNFPKRFDQHRRDAWWEPLKYRIYYSQITSQTDAEALEAHYIALYRSHNFHNKAKSNWGLCSFAPKIKWTEYNFEQSDLNTERGIAKWEDLLWARIHSIDADVETIKHKTEWVRDRMIELQEAEERLRRKSIRAWFRSAFDAPSFVRGGGRLAKQLLYDLYRVYYDSDVAECDLYAFDDADDFWDALMTVPEYAQHVRGDVMLHLSPKNDEPDEYEIEASKRLGELYAQIMEEE